MFEKYRIIQPIFFNVIFGNTFKIIIFIKTYILLKNFYPKLKSMQIINSDTMKVCCGGIDLSSVDIKF